jgi:phosphoglycolate phosphatase-like HAD superfamily hydrolase
VISITASLKLIIFDLDDTLIRSNINYMAIRLRVAELFESPPSEKELSGTPILIVLENLRKLHPERYQEGKKRIYETEEQAAKTATVIDGAHTIPNLLDRHRIHSAILTNNSQTGVEIYLDNPELSYLKKFKIFTRDDFSQAKPSPEGIQTIITHFSNHVDKEISNDNSLYIGDSYIDALAAERAGVRFVWFHSRKIANHLFPTQPLATLSNWNQLESLITSFREVESEQGKKRVP